MGERPSSCIPPPPYVRVDSSQFLLESHQPGPDRGVCRAPRLSCVEVPMHNPRYTISSRGCKGPCIIVILQWRFGVGNRVPGAPRSPFRQLGRQSPDGEETPLSPEIWRREPPQLSKLCDNAKIPWWRLDWRCLLGMICRSLASWSWWSWSPTNQSLDGSRKRCGHVGTILKGR